MLESSEPSSGLLFFSFLYRSDLHKETELAAKVHALYGVCIQFAPAYNPLINYYTKEMGSLEHLKRFFLVPVSSVPREFFLSAKLLALDWEYSLLQDQKRMANIDVGFISAENFILATTKNYSHRIFLGQRIFADLTYQFSGGKFEPLPWCYPDYQDEQKLEFFTWCRSYLLSKR